MRVRPLDAGSEAELELVARRMRATLVEVVDPERGAAMYTLDWLRDRVRFHLDPARSTGAVFVAELDGEVVGHGIVRMETDDAGARFGLYSTTYVAPAHRRRGAAGALLDAGEAWFAPRAPAYTATWTADGNGPLIGLYQARGYVIAERADAMVRLVRPWSLTTGPRGPGR